MEKLIFREALMNLINDYSKEGESNTPDYILAMYMEDSLEAFDNAVNHRNIWYSKDTEDGECSYCHGKGCKACSAVHHLTNKKSVAP